MRLDQLSSRATRAACGCAIALGFTIPVSVALDNVLLGAILLPGWPAPTSVKNSTALAAIAWRWPRSRLFGLLAAGIAWSDQRRRGPAHARQVLRTSRSCRFSLTLFRDARHARSAPARF